jgi:hypothetical protein
MNVTGQRRGTRLDMLSNLTLLCNKQGESGGAQCTRLYSISILYVIPYVRIGYRISVQYFIYVHYLPYYCIAVNYFTTSTQHVALQALLFTKYETNNYH